MTDLARPRLTAVVLSYNGMSHLPGCLDSIAAQTLDLFQLIVVDNGSTDGSADYVQQHHPTARLIRLTGNTGFCKGMNVGAQSADAELVLLLNQDITIHPDCFRQLLETWDEPPEDCLDDRAGVVSPRPGLGVFAKIMFYDAPSVINSFGVDWFKETHWRDYRVGLPDAPDLDRSETVFGSIFPAVMFHRQRFLDMGAFDELFWSYCEDFDVCYRGNILGYRFITSPKAMIHHKYRASSTDKSDPLRSRFWFIRNYLLVFLKNYRLGLLMKHGRQIYRRYLGNALTIAKRNGNAPEVKMYRRILLSLLKHSPRILMRRRWVQKRRVIQDEVLWRNTSPIEDFNIFHVEDCPVLSLLSMRYAKGKVDSYDKDGVEFRVR